MSIEPTDQLPDNLDEFTEVFEASSKPVVQEQNQDPVDDEPLVEDEPADEQTEPEDTSDPEEEAEPVKPPKKNRTFQDRINELTAERREAERALKELQDQLAKKETETANAATSSAPSSAAPNPDEKNSDGSDKYPLGEFDPAYIRDMARHTINEEWAEKKKQDAAEQARVQEQEARDALHSSWLEKLNPVAEQHSDFLDKTLELEATFEGLDAQYSDYLVQTIKSLDHGPEVLYYFANNLDEASKFVAMGPLNATLALGEINAMFKGRTRSDPKISAAPPPPQVNKGVSARRPVAGDTEDLEAFSDVFFSKKK